MSVRNLLACAVLATLCASVIAEATPRKDGSRTPRRVAASEDQSAGKPGKKVGRLNKRQKAKGSAVERRAARAERAGTFTAGHPGKRALAKRERMQRAKTREIARAARLAVTHPAGAQARAAAIASPFGTTLLSETFDTGIPAGWAVLDNAGSGMVWTNLAGCQEAGNFTGGAGDVACASSDLFGMAEFDTELRTPVINFSAFTAPASLSFNANFQAFTGKDGIELLDVDYSTNGAAGPWTNLLSWTTDQGAFRNTPGVAPVIDIAAVMGQANVMFRFHYYNPGQGDWDWYAQVDDVVVQAVPVTVPCSLTCPLDVIQNNDPTLCSAVVSYAPPTPAGQCGQVFCAPASGGTFPVGTTPVVCDEQPPPGSPLGLLASCTFNVTVVDAEPPLIACPVDQLAVLPFGDTTVPVNYPAPTSSDNCTNPPPTSCAPPSGSGFAEGTSPVSCIATDAAQNSANCGFDVIVTAEVQELEIPTASSYGLAALALLLAGAGLLLLRRN